MSRPPGAPIEATTLLLPVGPPRPGWGGHPRIFTSRPFAKPTPADRCQSLVFPDPRESVALRRPPRIILSRSFFFLLRRRRRRRRRHYSSYARWEQFPSSSSSPDVRFSPPKPRGHGKNAATRRKSLSLSPNMDAQPGKFADKLENFFSGGGGTRPIFRGPMEIVGQKVFENKLEFEKYWLELFMIDGLKELHYIF